MSLPVESLPQIRFDITEASRILRMSRATLYERVRLCERQVRRSHLDALRSCRSLVRIQSGARLHACVRCGYLRSDW
jgi:hypothetical protein